MLWTKDGQVRGKSHQILCYPALPGRRPAALAGCSRTPIGTRSLQTQKTSFDSSPYHWKLGRRGQKQIKMNACRSQLLAFSPTHPFASYLNISLKDPVKRLYCVLRHFQATASGRPRPSRKSGWSWTTQSCLTATVWILAAALEQLFSPAGNMEGHIWCCLVTPVLFRPPLLPLPGTGHSWLLLPLRVCAWLGHANSCAVPSRLCPLRLRWFANLWTNPTISNNPLFWVLNIFRCTVCLQLPLKFSWADCCQKGVMGGNQSELKIAKIRKPSLKVTAWKFFSWALCFTHSFGDTVSDRKKTHGKMYLFESEVSFGRQCLFYVFFK